MKKIIVFLIIVATSGYIYFNFNNKFHRSQNEDNPSSVVGTTGKYGIREDIESWIEKLNLDKPEKNALINLALADKEIFKNSEPEETLIKVLQEHDVRTQCLMKSFSNKNKFTSTVVEFRQLTFNTKERIEAFQKVQALRSKEWKINSPSQQDCVKYLDKIIPIKIN